MIVDRPLLKIRQATPEDSRPLAVVFRDCWRHAYAGIIPALHLDRMIRGRDDQWWRNAIERNREMLVLDVAGVVAGYATFGRSRGNTRYQGEIYEIYLTPIYQGIGFGEHLFEACRQQLDLRDYNGLIIWALTDNQRAADFYWRRGGRPVAEVKERFGPKTLTKTAFAWK
ncbi:MAG: GNAT family N-acetyltransferase [Hyphomicrobium sp.]|nr:GNAT family N-acetyltransferase [Hyphomicrobium sp.]